MSILCCQCNAYSAAPPCHWRSCRRIPLVGQKPDSRQPQLNVSTHYSRVKMFAPNISIQQSRYVSRLPDRFIFLETRAILLYARTHQLFRDGNTFLAYIPDSVSTCHREFIRHRFTAVPCLGIQAPFSTQIQLVPLKVFCLRKRLLIWRWFLESLALVYLPSSLSHLPPRR